MDHNGSYYYWGMHMGWWVLILVIVIAIFGFTRFQRKK
jgi:Sec-independent protein translocase protein TatA